MVSGTTANADGAAADWRRRFLHSGMFVSVISLLALCLAYGCTELIGAVC